MSKVRLVAENGHQGEEPKERKGILNMRGSYCGKARGTSKKSGESVSRLGVLAMCLVCLLALVSCGKNQNVRVNPEYEKILQEMQAAKEQQVVVPQVDPREESYFLACDLLIEGSYDEALAEFEKLGDYLDSEWRAEAIRCIPTAEMVAEELSTGGNLAMDIIVGASIECFYTPDTYTFREVVEISEDSLFGAVLQLGELAGSVDYTNAEEGAKNEAEELYFKYFYNRGFLRIACEIEYCDRVSGRRIIGRFSVEEDLMGGKPASKEEVEAYAKTREFIVEGTELVGYRGTGGTIHVPEGVTKIKYEALMGNESIEEIYLPSSLREIGECAFSDCKNLKEIHLSKNLEEIGAYAFSGTAIETLRLPASLISAGGANQYAAYDGCPNLKEIHYDGTVEQWYALEGPIRSEEQQTTVYCSDGTLDPVLQGMPGCIKKETKWTGTFYDAAAGAEISIIAYGDPEVTWAEHFASYSDGEWEERLMPIYVAGSVYGYNPELEEHMQYYGQDLHLTVWYFPDGTIEYLVRKGVGIYSEEKEGALVPA